MSRITGLEANIKRCMEREPAQLVDKQLANSGLVAEAICKPNPKERQEQKVFSAYLARQRAAGRLYYVSPYAHKASTITEGHPDYTIWLPNGFVFCLEMKASGGTLSARQRDVHTELGCLAHVVRVAWSAAQAEQITAFYLSRAKNQQPLIAHDSRSPDRQTAP